MSLTRNAAAVAVQAANSRWLELSTRAGFVGYGLVHLLFAWLALRIAFGTSSGEEANQNAALRTLRDQSYGAVPLTLAALGIAAFGIYCFLQSRYRRV